jgi:hypothetical protein
MMVSLLTAAPAAAQPIEPLGPQLRLTHVGADGDPAVDSYYSDVAYNSVRDEYLVAWAKSDGFPEIWARRLQSDGSPAGEPFLVRGASAGYPAVAYDPERDRYGVAFTQFSGGGSEVLVQRISGDGRLIHPNGAPGAAPTWASLTPGTNGMFPEIVYRPDANGDSSPGDRWIVAYRTSHPGSKVYLSAVGTTTGDALVDRQVSAMPAAGEAEYPSLAVVPGTDDLLVAWEGYPSDDDSAEIWVNRVGGHLPALDTGQVPITTTGGSARRPSIAADPDTNRFLVAYSASETATEGGEIHVQRIDAGLGQVGVDDQQVSSAGPPDTGSRFWVIAPAAAYHQGLRRYLVTWVGSDDGRPGYADGELEVTGTVLDADGVEAAPQDFAISRMGAPGSNLVDFVQPMTSAIAADPGSKRWLVLWDSDDPQPPLADDEYETYGRFVGELPPPNAAPAPLGLAGTQAAPTLTKARLVRRFRVRATHTRVRRLAVTGATPGMRIELRCRGGGCPRPLRRIDVTRAGTVNLKPFLRRARLRPGAVLSVRIIEPGALSRVVRLRIRDDRRPLAL